MGADGNEMGPEGWKRGSGPKLFTIHHVIETVVARTISTAERETMDIVMRRPAKDPGTTERRSDKRTLMV